MIQEDKLIEKLNNLKKIGPSDDLTNKLRGVILSTPRPQRHIWNISRFKIPAKESFGFALSIGFVAVLIAVVIGITSETNNPIVATNTTKTNSVGMINEANAAVDNINIHLAEVDTFDSATEQTSNALSSVNPSLIGKESSNINSSTATEGDNALEIDSVLNQLSK